MFVFLIHLPHLANSSSSLFSTFKKHEDIKRRAYGQRIREVEHVSFTPIVMSATGGWLTRPQFSTSVWLPSYRLSGVMNTL